MSDTFDLICPETRCSVWVGQGWGEMEAFYSNDKDAMACLAQFLKDHQGMELRFVNDDRDPGMDERAFYSEYEMKDGKVVVTPPDWDPYAQA